MFLMERKFKRPEKKAPDVKVTDADMVYFSLGLKDSRPFVLPSERDNYLTDERAVQLVKEVRAGKNLSNRDFSGLNLKGADISGGSFSGCSFKGAVFYKTLAQTADFSNCCFEGAYLEESDLSGCNFTGASFKRAFFKKNKTDEAFFDADSEKYLTELEKIIHLIESGAIDIRTLSQEDLICLDVRRLDFSKIDLTDIDLSVFALDGINLCGTYIDPKQLMSLEGWNSYCLDVQKTKEKTRERLCRKILLDRSEELKVFHKECLKMRKKQKIQTEKLNRPPLKEPEKEENRSWGIQYFYKEQAAKEREKQEAILKTQQEFQQQREHIIRTAAEQEKQRTELNLSGKEETPPILKPEAVLSNGNNSLKTADKNEQIKEKRIDAADFPATEPKETAQDLADKSPVKTAPETIDAKETAQKPADKLQEPASNVSAQSERSETKRQNQEQESVTVSDFKNVISAKPAAMQPKIIVSHQQTRKNEIKVDALNQNAYLFEQKKLPQKEQNLFEPSITVPKEPEPLLKPKPTGDESETVHDLTNAGYNIEEISQIVRERGPMRVRSKAPNLRPVKRKTKG